ncbi:hypothetical protein ACM0CQ_05975 [Mycobacteroides abscessus subsp. abscessus]|uniref:hypothetical protein n=1 Tax=Mycobacteroides abscessus TaxID=36809 RepID=UPI0010423E07|nr:hypothetical protein [Mycobacteroides abscessus]
MSTDEPTSWESYEEVARFLLGKWGDAIGLGLERVEAKQTLVGRSGILWTIDAKAVRTGGEAILVVECRRYTTSRLKQKPSARWLTGSATSALLVALS